MRRLLVASLVMLLASVNLTAAQDRATLVADSVTVQSGTTLAATGHVEVFFKGQRLTAAAITYDACRAGECASGAACRLS